MTYKIIRYIDQCLEKRYCITDEFENFYLIKNHSYSSALNINDIFESLSENELPAYCSTPHQYHFGKKEEIEIILEFDSFINFTEKFPEYYI